MLDLAGVQEHVGAKNGKVDMKALKDFVKLGEWWKDKQAFYIFLPLTF